MKAEKGEGQVSQKKGSKKVFYTSIALCILLLAALGVIVNGIIQETAKHQDNQQPAPTPTVTPGTPELVNVDLKCSLESGKLHVTGYVKNVGDAKANNCTLHVNSVVDGEAGAELWAALEPFEAGEQRMVDLEFPFTATGIVAFNTYLKWTN
jgi:archaellum component FlaG (FlaF/FlaG flagellin family)